MSLISSALNTGRSAVLSYQSALEVVGQNVANAGNADYSRQVADLSAAHGTPVGPNLQPGAGVNVTGLQRYVDEALENRLRNSIGELNSASSMQSQLARVEALFDNISGADVSTKMVEMFNSFSDVQNTPDDLAIRGVAVANAQSVADSIRGVRSDLLEIGLETNDQIEAYVKAADDLATEIADLNSDIVSIEAAGQGVASSLRDRRDAALRDLSELFDVSVREQPDGSINVYINSEPLVQHGTSRGLTTVQQADGDFIRASVRFADTNTQVRAAGGKIAGLVEARDEQAFGRVATLDEFAAAMIREVNAIHADGQGLNPVKIQTGSTLIADPDAALNDPASGLSLTPVNGSFYVTVTDTATETPKSYRIEVDLDGQGADTTLNDIIDQINNQVEGLSAGLTPDGRFQLEADGGFAFSFGHDGDQFRQDTSGTLAALGINTFFEGTNAADIQVRQELIDDPGLLAAASQNHIGDGNNAGRLAGAIDTASSGLNGVSLRSYYNNLANSVASAGAAASDRVEAADAVNSALEGQREAVSGVSLDEEAISMLKFERAFQGAARYVSTVDRMLQEMMALAQ